ncbi:MAG: hypothetical protein JJU02_11085 [Cryomorphaceae bacterium]|nr:hypothetical protein [Cryomorphaceae bacterium]
MKKFVICSLFLGGLLSSCSKEDLSSSQNDPMVSFMIQNNEVEDFLDDFYPEDYIFGDIVEIDSIDYRITEVIVGDDELARGYIVQEMSSGAFLYFLDVDRDSHISTSYDNVLDSEHVFDDIDEQPMYAATNGFDVIGFLNGDYEDPTEWHGRPFWGTGYTYGPCNPATQTRVQYSQHYVLWIKNGPAQVANPMVPC